MKRRSLILLILLAITAGAQPLIEPDAATMNLDDLGLYRVGCIFRGQQEREFPVGWSGPFDDKTGVACESCGVQQSQRAFLIHCPWRSGTGSAFQEFRFRLPAVSRAVLRGATAMRTDAVGRSDGVTFRIYTNGGKALEYHQTNDVWREFELDVTAPAGATVTARFEVDPGPKGNSAFDFSLWGNRRLVLEGFKAPPVSSPLPCPLVLSNVWSVANGEVAPRDGFRGTATVEASDQGATFRYAGPDGSLSYAWTKSHSAEPGLFGDLKLTAHMIGGEPKVVPLAVDAKISWIHEATLQASRFEPTNRGALLRQEFQVGTNRVTVNTLGQLIGKSLVLSISADQSSIEKLEGGSWGPVQRRKRLVVPYLPGSAYYLPRENLFVSAFLDWTSSAASSQNATRAYYQPATDGRRNLLRERLVYSAAWHQAEVFPNLPAPPSPYLDYLSDKVILDIWGGNFRKVAGQLENLADYGMTNCVALLHVWQRSGYDNALPAHVPANARQGGDEGMAYLVATAKRLGMRAALHENYVDYYPNYEGFNTNDIALDSRGNLVKAWLNEGTKIQSFAVKPTAILRLAQRQSPDIHRRYQTEACYLDVHSAVQPWFHVDSRAGEPGSSRFDTVWDAHRQLFAYERATHGGPVFGEGNRHAYWSGWLDGAEAQFGTGWPDKQGLSAPLHVDFDLLKIHPLQLNHGMGYYERWWPEGATTHWHAAVPLVVLDQYRVQEIAYGHAGFLGGSTYAKVPYAWLEHHLMSPLTARYGNARPAAIAYRHDGQWVDPTAAARLETPRDCVRVGYDSGLTITANGGTNQVVEAGWVLPRFGWLAQAKGFTAGTVVRQGVTTDFSDSGDSLFVNARNARDWNLSGARQIRPEVVEFKPLPARAFQVTYRWHVGERLASDYPSFVHFCQGPSLVFQQDHPLSTPTSRWQPGQMIPDGPHKVTLPSQVADGEYEWVTGLFDPEEGKRLTLEGPQAGQSRIRLGTLRVADGGAEVKFMPAKPADEAAQPDLFSLNLNTSGAVIDFGDLRTDGSLWIHREGREWVLKTWPRERAFVLELSQSRFGSPGVIRCQGGSSAVTKPEARGDRWALPLTGAREYRWGPER